jgi:hypothetical protein
MPVADGADAFGGEGFLAIPGLDHDVIIPQRVVLVELHAGAGR